MDFSAGLMHICTKLSLNPCVGGHCIVLIRKLQGDTNNLIETAFYSYLHGLAKIDNNVAVL